MSAKKKNITLNSVIKDKTSGSSELLSKLNSHFLNEIQNPDKIRKEFGLAEEKFKDFAVILDYIHKIKTFLDNEEMKILSSFLEEFSEREERTFDNIYKKCRIILKGKNKILTLSNSKTLYEVLHRLKKDIKNLEVIVCESEPGKEGKILAEKLAVGEINTIVIPDSAIRDFIQKSQAVIIGADKILKNRNVVNKTGSRNAAMICKQYQIPFYVPGMEFSIA